MALHLEESAVVDYMKTVHEGEGNCREEPLFTPEGGTCYAFYSAKDKTKKRDWRADGYRWRQNGAKRIQIGEHLLKKTYFHIYIAPKKVSRDFQRIAYECDDFPYVVVIFYKGNSGIAGSFPHGNRRCDFKPHVMTRPSILSACRESSGNARLLYEEMLVSTKADSAEYPVSIPRDLMQIQNTQRLTRCRYQAIEDFLHTMEVISENTDSFCWEIETEPNLIVMLFNDSVLENFSCLLFKLSFTDSEMISVFPTLTVDNFTVSTLLYKSKLVSIASAIPLLYFVYEDETEVDEELFWNLACRKIPKLQQLKGIEFVSRGKIFLEDDLIPHYPVKVLERIVKRLRHWEQFPMDAASDLKCNATDLYKLSLHYANLAMDGMIDCEKYQTYAGHENFFDATSNEDDHRGCMNYPPLGCEETSTVKRRKNLLDSRKNQARNNREAIERAKSIIPSHIKLSLKKRCFLVSDERLVYEVKLFPIESCTCPLGQCCEHIIACKVSLGICKEEKVPQNNPQRSKRDDDEDQRAANVNSADATSDSAECDLIFEESRNVLDDCVVMDISKEVTIMDNVDDAE